MAIISYLLNVTRFLSADCNQYSRPDFQVVFDIGEAGDNIRYIPVTYPYMAGFYKIKKLFKIAPGTCSQT